MTLALVRNWWALVIRGLVGIFVGLVAFAHPGATLLALPLVFGFYVLSDGVVAIAGAVAASRADERWGTLLLEGIVGIGAGLVMLFWPGVTLFALIWIMGVRAVVTGIAQIFTAIRLRKHITGEWLLVLGGVLSVVFGAVILGSPIAAALVLAYWLGGYVVVFGSVLVLLGFRLRARTKTAGAEGSILLGAH